jgi:hypothetical protein
VKRIVIIAVVFSACALAAQTQTTATPATLGYGSIYTPEIHIGSASTPSTITVPPVVEVRTGPPSAYVSNAPPASTELLSERHFEFVVAPMEQAAPGSMEDTSVSLGDYARQLRAEKQKSPTPDSMAQPTNPK